MRVAVEDRLVVVRGCVKVWGVEVRVLLLSPLVSLASLVRFVRRVKREGRRCGRDIC